jgi:hypothetical protein
VEKKKKNPLLFVRPRAFLYVRVEMVVPPFSALLSLSLVHFLRDFRPLFCPELLNEFYQLQVLFFGPNLFLSFARTRIRTGFDRAHLIFIN